MTIFLSDGENIREFIQRELDSRLTKRYKMTHMAEDMDISYSMLHRFMSGRGVGDELYIKAFQYLMK